MSDSVQIQFSPDGKAVDAWFKKLYTSSKKPVEIKTKTSAAGGGSQERKPYFSKGAAIADQGTSGNDQFIRGGFYEALKDKGEAFKNAKDMFQKNKTANKEMAESISDIANPKAGGSTRSMTIMSADIKHATFHNGGGPGGEGHHNPGSNVGSTATSAGGAAPYIGIALAIAGGIMKTISSLGEKYTSTMMSQSGTIGALGSYRGGGGAYFQNAEVAQGTLAYARSRGDQTQLGAQSRSLTGEDMQFAASQGMGLSQFAESLGEIERSWDKASLNVVRSYASASKIGFLKQGEYIQQIGSYTKSLREEGLKTGNLSEFLGVAAGISRASNSPERGLTVAQTLDKSVRGADRGGIMGNIGLMLAMQKYNGDTNKAMRASESGEMLSSAMDFMTSRGELEAGFMMRDTLGNFTSGADLAKKYKSAGPGTPMDMGRTGGIEALAHENAYQEAVVKPGGAGEKAAKIGYDAASEMLKMFEKNEAMMGAIATGINKIEMGTFKYIGEGITDLTETMDLLQKGEFGKALIKIAKGGAMNMIPGSSAANLITSIIK